MHKKIIHLVSSVIILIAAGNAFAGVTYWTDGYGDHLWSNSANWDAGAPALGDNAYISSDSPGAFIGSLGAVGNFVFVGVYDDGALEMDGGYFQVAQRITLGYDGNSGFFNFIDGTVDARDFYAGLSADGVLDMHKGTMNVEYLFCVGVENGSVGHVNLKGGTITVGNFTMRRDAGSVGTLDITGGKLIVDGDRESVLQGYIDNGWITVDGGSGTPKVDYNITTPNKTTLYAPSAWEGKASNPSPGDGEIVADSLSWSGIWTGPGEPTTYRVYVSDDRDKVVNRDSGVKVGDAFVVGTSVPDIAAAGVELVSLRRYYWAVDCIKTGEDDLVGDVWEFVIDDLFEANPALGSVVPYQLKQLGWKLPVGAGNISCDVYFGTDPNPLNLPKLVDKQAVESVGLSVLEDNTTYYWQVAVYDDSVSATVPWKYSPVYSFAVVQRQKELLDRGVVAVYKGSGEVFVGWRMFIDDPSEIGFNVYRGGVKINSSPVTDATNYTDYSGSAGSSYSVAAVIDGVEQTLSASVSAWSGEYLTIPLQTPSGYTPNDASVGDLDGDGQYEIVVKQELNPQDNSNSGTTGQLKLEAYELDGTFMWRIDLGVNIREGAHYTQFMVYDFDGDGKAEIACKTADGTVDGEGNVIGNASADYRNAEGRILDGPEFFTVFDGQTGGAITTVDYIVPRGNICDWGDCYGNRVDRFLACVAYLDGIHPSIVMCRGYYTRTVLTAWDFRNGKLTHRWTFDSDDTGNGDYAGQGNHNLAVGDVDGDGKDEIIYGGCAIDDDGTGLYTTGLGHGDAMHLSDLDPEREGLEVWSAHEGTSPAGGEFRDADSGALIWGKPSGDVGRAMTAEIDPRYDGCESWASGVSNVYDCKGNFISSRKPPSCNMAVWWDGDLGRELLDGTKIDKWNHLSRNTTRLLSAHNYGGASNNGTKANPCLSADILGDWREEVIWRNSDNQSLMVFTTTIPTSYRFYTFMHDPIYRASVAWQNVAYNQPTQVGFYMGTDMEAPTPDAMSFAVDPTAVSSISLTMTATTATAYGHGGVEYYFECLTEGGHDSGWQRGRSYTDTGLETNKNYDYRVKARGLSHLETAYSAISSVELSLDGDFSGDGYVDTADLVVLALNWLNECSGLQWCDDGDKIDMSYFSTLASNWLLP